MIRESNRHWLTWEKDRTERELRARIQRLRDALLVLFCIAGIILTLFLTGCATPYWKQTSAPSASYSWHVISRSELDARCPSPAKGLLRVEACAIRRPDRHCDVYSVYTEKEADQTFFTHKHNIREHELKHCEGWEHD